MTGGDITNIQFYRNIVKAAKKKGISINSLEEEAGLSRGSVCKWDKVSPSMRSLKKVADVLGCTLDELSSEEQEVK